MDFRRQRDAIFILPRFFLTCNKKKNLFADDIFLSLVLLYSSETPLCIL